MYLRSWCQLQLWIARPSGVFFIPSHTLPDCKYMIRVVPLFDGQQLLIVMSSPKCPHWISLIRVRFILIRSAPWCELHKWLNGVASLSELIHNQASALVWVPFIDSNDMPERFPPGSRHGGSLIVIVKAIWRREADEEWMSVQVTRCTSNGIQSVEEVSLVLLAMEVLYGYKARGFRDAAAFD